MMEKLREALEWWDRLERIEQVPDTPHFLDPIVGAARRVLDAEEVEICVVHKELRWPDVEACAIDDGTCVIESWRWFPARLITEETE